jgi:hypothetical protein
MGNIKRSAAKPTLVLPVSNSASAKTLHPFTRPRLSVLTLTNIGSASDFKPYSSSLPLPCLCGATRINGSRRLPSYGEATTNNNATSLSSNTSLRLPGASTSPVSGGRDSIAPPLPASNVISCRLELLHPSGFVALSTESSRDPVTRLSCTSTPDFSGCHTFQISPQVPAVLLRPQKPSCAARVTPFR